MPIPYTARGSKILNNLANEMIGLSEFLTTLLYNVRVSKIFNFQAIEIIGLS